MRSTRTIVLALLLVAVAVSGTALAQQGPSFTLGGTTYTKWLWGNSRDQGALYSFKDAPGEGYGDNGQGTEIELLLNAKALEVRRGAGPPPQPLQPELLDELGGWGQSVERRRLLRLGHLGRLRRVRPAVEPVRQAPRRHGHAHPGLQLARLGHDRLERLGHVRPVRRRPDPLHRPRQRPGPPLPGLGHRQVAHVGRRPDLPAAPLGRPRTTTPATTTRPTGPTWASSSTPAARLWDVGGLVQWVNDIEVDQTGHQLGQRARTRGCGSATPSSAPRSGSTRAPRSTRRPRSTTRPTSRPPTWRPPASA